MYTLSEVQRRTGASRQLIAFLVRDRRIPWREIGPAKVLDEKGLTLIREALADYQSRSESGCRRCEGVSRN